MPAGPRRSEAKLDNPVEIIICRTFDAPRDLVWRAWTDPQHVGRWWGPAGYTTTTHSMDFRPGGAWRYTMHGADGRDYANRIDYLEIDAPARLVYQLGGEEPDDSVSFRTEVSFEPIGNTNRQTRVTMRSIFPTAEARDFVISNFGAVEGGKQHLANLADYLDRTWTADQEDAPFSISRVFPAIPREMVWQAWTERAQLLRWFGPQGSTMSQATLDLRVGGMFHYRLSDPQGMDLWGRWIFRTIDRPNLLEFVSSFSNADGDVTLAPFPGLDDFPAELLTAVTLVEHAGVSKGTLVTIEARPLNATRIQRDFFSAFHSSLQQGWAGTLQRLSESLSLGD